MRRVISTCTSGRRAPCLSEQTAIPSGPRLSLGNRRHGCPDPARHAIHKDRHLKTRSGRHVVNRLIDGLPSKERAAVLGRCDVVEIAFGKVLFETGPTIRHAYFPLNGFISLLTLLDGRQPLEMALIGNEGMVGITLTLTVRSKPATVSHSPTAQSHVSVRHSVASAPAAHAIRSSTASALQHSSASTVRSRPATVSHGPAAQSHVSAPRATQRAASTRVVSSKGNGQDEAKH